MVEDNQNDGYPRVDCNLVVYMHVTCLVCEVIIKVLKQKARMRYILEHFRGAKDFAPAKGATVVTLLTDRPNPRFQ